MADWVGSVPVSVRGTAATALSLAAAAVGGALAAVATFSLSPLAVAGAAGGLALGLWSGLHAAELAEAQEAA